MLRKFARCEKLYSPLKRQARKLSYDLLLRGDTAAPVILKFLQFYPNFIDEGEEAEVCKELRKKFEKKKYLTDHWDSVISKYRETVSLK